MQQFPQNISEQYSQTSYSYLREYFYFLTFHTRYSLFYPFCTSSKRNRRKDLKASISACISTNKSFRFYSFRTQLGKLLVPSPTAATQNFPDYDCTNATAATTTKVSLSCSFLNFFLQAYRKRCQDVSLIHSATSIRVFGSATSMQQQFNSKIIIFEEKMQILMPSTPSIPDDALNTHISPSSIRLRPKNSEFGEKTKGSLLQRCLPICGSVPLSDQNSHHEYSLQANRALPQQITKTPNSRETKIFSVVQSEKRENSAAQTRNSYGLKQQRRGIKVVSRQKKRSLSKQKEDENSLKNMGNFPVTSDSLTFGQDQKQNRSTMGVRIKQPQFLKAHPLRMGKINGSCMGKLIVQRAIQERQHCFINQKNNSIDHSHP